ncbi:MAG: utilization substance protein [Pseudomonadota bacterium]|jgi:N utilization substance protein B
MGPPPEKQRGSSDVARSKTLARRGARLAAVQSLYQMDIAGTGIDAVIGERLGYAFEIDRDNGAPLPVLIRDGGDLPDPDSTFMSEILRGVVRRQRDIDAAVDQQLATGWRLARIDSTVRAILRAAVFELVERPDVPVRVVISEYVQIADAFFSGDEPKVVNGILDALARKYRSAEFEDRSS